MFAARFWLSLHFALMAFGAFWFGLAAWALRVPFFVLGAAICLTGAVRYGAQAFGERDLAPPKWHPAIPAVATAVALGVCVASLAPALWRWLH
ncbi:MAG TPA: hypothetical protein VIM57_03185 [Luteolibacter sp.]